MNPAMLPIVCASAGLPAAAKTMIRLSTRRVMCRPFAPAAPLCAPHDRQIFARITSDRHLNFELFSELELQSISISWAGLAAIALSRPKALPGIESDAKHEARAHSEIPRGATHVLESVESR